MGDRASVVVKVGKTSSLRLRNIKALRAITFSDIDRLVARFSNIRAVIIESIMPYEIKDALSTIDRLIERGVLVYLYCVDGGNMQESEISNKYKIDIANSLDELQYCISRDTNITVYTAWCRGIESGVDVYDTVSNNLDDNEYRNNSDARYDLKEALYSISSNKETSEQGKSIVISNKDEAKQCLGDTDLSGVSTNMATDSMSIDISRLTKLVDNLTKEKQALAVKVDNANTKIEELLGLKARVEQERDDLYIRVQAAEELAKGIKDNTSDVDKLARVADNLAKTDGELSELRKYNIALETTVTTYESDNRLLRDRVELLDNEVDRLKNELDSVNKELDSKINQIDKLKASSSSNESMKVELVALKSDKESLESVIESLNERVERLGKELETANSQSNTDDLEKISELRHEINELNNQLISSRKDTSLEVQGRLLLNMLLAESMRRGDELSGNLAEKSGEISELNTLIKKLKDSINNSESELHLLTMKYNEAVNKIENLMEKHTSEISDIQDKYDSEISKLVVEIESKQIEQSKVKGKLDAALMEISEKDRELLEKDRVYRNSREEVNRVKDINLELEQENASLNDRNINLNAKITRLDNEVSKYEARVALTEEANIKLEQMNKKLREEVESKEHKKQDNEAVKEMLVQGNLFKLNLGCEYTGSAKIVSVFGSGSVGITTVAMSLAKRLGKCKVLYMDLDIMSPKANEWFNKVPFIKVNNIPQLKSSSLGILIERGEKYAMGKSNIIQNVESNKLGYRLDYFSGSYTRIDPRKIMLVNFTEYMNYLGNNYDYIVIDLGKIGASEVNDELIKMFTGISDSSIFVTLNNTSEARLAQIHLADAGIQSSKLVWALNMVSSSSVNDFMRKVIGDAKCVMIEKDINRHGDMMLLGNVDRLKGMFSRLVNLVVDT